MMLAIVVALTAALAFATLWPELPFGKAAAQLAVRAIAALLSTGFQARALLAIGVALLLFATIWALQGDAPMVLAMALPELSAWFATFEIVTLVDALVGVGSAYIAIRASGAMNYLKGRLRARRTRATHRNGRMSANDDEPGRWALAA